MRSIGGGEVIQLIGEIGSHVTPDGFLWRGKRHRIRRVESYRRTAPPGRAGGGLVQRIKVVTEEGLRCTLLMDSERGMWKMDGIVLVPAKEDQ